MNPSWKNPPRIKVYEALGAIGDNRIELENNTTKVYSSSRNKFYTVEYFPKENGIISNDNGSYWQGYLGYPSISILLLNKVLTCNPIWITALKDIKWKDINVKNKGDFSKTENEVLDMIQKRGFSREELILEVDDILEQIMKLNIKKVGKRIKPPKGY